MSFMPTFSIALSKARPIKNSRERSANPVSDKSHSKLHHRPTVDPLLVGKCLALLSPIPLDNQSISERQCGARVSRPESLLSASSHALSVWNLSVRTAHRNCTETGRGSSRCGARILSAKRCQLTQRLSPRTRTLTSNSSLEVNSEADCTT
jgi:hypothetical protein